MVRFDICQTDGRWNAPDGQRLGPGGFIESRLHVHVLAYLGQCCSERNNYTTGA